jgi:hypothetical protein
MRDFAESCLGPLAACESDSALCAFTSCRGVSPLHICAEFNSIHCLRVLLDDGADVNARAEETERVGGHTPIFHAVNSIFNYCRPAMEMLVDASSARPCLRRRSHPQRLSAKIMPVPPVPVSTTASFYTTDGLLPHRWVTSVTQFCLMLSCRTLFCRSSAVQSRLQLPSAVKSPDLAPPALEVHRERRAPRRRSPMTLGGLISPGRHELHRLVVKVRVQCLNRLEVRNVTIHTDDAQSTVYRPHRSKGCLDPVEEC